MKESVLLGGRSRRPSERRSRRACGGAEQGKQRRMVDEEDFYTVDETASILGFSPSRVRQMCRSGELEAERREGRIEGVLGPWRIRKDAVHAYSEGQASRAEREDAELADATTVASSPLDDSGPTGRPEPPVGQANAGGLDSDTPSEASELLSESVRELRERAEALVAELERLEGRLEFAEIQDLALREALRRETERSDELQARLEAERARRSESP